ncbi:hypothetical protein FOZ63_021095, partial [Perkinsus olseni]
GTSRGKSYHSPTGNSPEEAHWGPSRSASAPHSPGLLILHAARLLLRTTMLKVTLLKCIWTPLQSEVGLCHWP